MGIGGLLPDLLKCAGHEVNLRDFKGGIVERTRNKQSKKINRFRRKLRIGVDVSTWICSATFGFSDMLADERHLSNYGRASLIAEQNQNELNLQGGDENKTSKDARDINNGEEGLSKEAKSYIEKCAKHVMERVLELSGCAEVLVVFDGDKPPMKKDTVQKRRDARQEYERNRDAPINTEMRTDIDVEADIERRTKANRRAGAGKYMNIIIREIVDELIHFEVAFMFAPYEADGQLAFLSKENMIDLIVSEDSDLIAHGARSVMFKSEKNDPAKGKIIQITDIGALNPTMSSKNINFIDFSPIMLATLFVAAGCDYCDKLPGIGIVKATSAVRKAFLETDNNASDSPLSIMFSELYKECNVGNLTAEFRRKYEEDFVKALLMYRHPVVYDPTIQACAYVNDPLDGGGDIELLQFEPYKKICQDEKKLSDAVGDIHDAAREERVEGIGRERHPPVLQVPADVSDKGNVPDEEPLSEDELDDEDGLDTQDVGPSASKPMDTVHLSQEDEDMPETQDIEPSSSSKLNNMEDEREEGTQQSDDNIFDTQETDPQASKRHDKEEAQQEGKDQEGVDMLETEEVVRPASKQNDTGNDLEEGGQQEDDEMPQTQETGSSTLAQGDSTKNQQRNSNTGNDDRQQGQKEPPEQRETQPENAGDTGVRNDNSTPNEVIELLSSDEEEDFGASNGRPIDLSQDDDDDVDIVNASQSGPRVKRLAPKIHPTRIKSSPSAQARREPSTAASPQGGTAKRRASNEASPPDGRTKRRTISHGATAGSAPQNRSPKKASSKHRTEYV